MYEPPPAGVAQRRPGSWDLPDCHTDDADIRQFSDMDLALALGDGRGQMRAEERLLQVLVVSETPAEVA